MEIVDDPSTDESIWWLPTGDSFVISPKPFHQTLDRCFQGSKLFSFIRKLYRYGFRKVVTSYDCAVDDLVFFHACFQKEKLVLLQYVTASNNKQLCCSSSQAIEKQIRQVHALAAANKVASQASPVNASHLPTRLAVPVITTSSFANSITNRPINSLFDGSVLPFPNHSGLMNAMIGRTGSAGHVNPIRTVHAVGNMNQIRMRTDLILAREQLLQQQRLQSSLFMVPPPIPNGGNYYHVPRGVNQSQILNCLIRRRLAELQASSSSHFRFP